MVAPRVTAGRKEARCTSRTAAVVVLVGAGAGAQNQGGQAVAAAPVAVVCPHRKPLGVAACLGHRRPGSSELQRYFQSLTHDGDEMAGTGWTVMFKHISYKAKTHLLHTYDIWSRPGQCFHFFPERVRGVLPLLLA